MAYLGQKSAYPGRVRRSDFDKVTVSQGQIPGVGLYPAQSASHTVFKVGTKYYYRNGLTGMTSLGNTNATTVIQGAYNAITTGTLFIKGGNYLISELVFDNPSAHVVCDQSVVFTYTGAGSAVTIDYTTDSERNFGYFVFGSIEGPGTTEGTGIETIGINVCNITVLGRIYNFLNAFYMNATGNLHQVDNTITINWITSFGKGIFTEAGTIGTLQGNEFIFNFIYNGQYCLYLKENTGRTTYNKFGGIAVDNAGVANSYCIYFEGTLETNCFEIPGYVGDATIFLAGGDFTGNYGISNQQTFIVGLQSNAWAIRGVGNRVINTTTYAGSNYSVPIVAEDASDREAFFNGGVPMHSNLMHIQLNLNMLVAGDAQAFYVYNTLMDVETSNVKIHQYDMDPRYPITIIGRDEGTLVEHEIIIVVVSGINMGFPSTVKVLVEVMT